MHIIGKIKNTYRSEGGSSPRLKYAHDIHDRYTQPIKPSQQHTPQISTIIKQFY